MAFMDVEGNAQGISVDILQYVASREGWVLRFVPCLWHTCLTKLERGDVDLLIDLAYSEQRATRFNFGEETVLVNWGVLYSRKEMQIETFLDLEGKTIAVLYAGIYYEIAQKIAETFHLECEFIGVDSYDKVMECVHSKRVDVGIVSRLFGIQHAQQFALHSNPIIFGPVDLRIASSHKTDLSVIQTIDRHLNNLKDDKNSLYYRSLERWLAELKIEVAPRWLPWALAACGTLIAAAVTFIFLMRALVKEKTAQLRENNDELQTEIDHRKVTEHQLERINRAYRLLLSCRPAITQTHNELDLLKQICQLIVEVGGYRLAWVGFAEQDEHKTVRPVVWKGSDGQYVRKLNISWSDDERGRGPTGRAIRNGIPSICRDVLTDPTYGLWREKALKHGYASSIALPLLDDNQRCFGALNIYSADSNAFDAQEVKLLTELATQLTTGIGNFRLQEAHRKTQDALHKSEQQYRELVENINDIIFTIDNNGIITYISPVVRQLSGYSPEEVVGRSFAEFIYPDDLMGLQQSFQRIISGNPEPFEYRVLTKAGELRWVYSSGRPIIRDGRIVGLRGMLTDITRRKKLEENFLRAQKMEAIARFTGGIAHDFNNMLTAILGYSEFLEDKLQHDRNLLNLIQEITKAGQRASSLTRQLLAFGRRQVLQPVVLDLNESIRELENMFQRLIGEDIKLKLRLDPELGSIRIDPSQIEQVIMNLVVNARDAMPEGGMLTIETSNIDLDEQYAQTHIDMAPGSYVLMSVSDNGHGIDKEILSDIFEPFFSTKRRDQGTGLGLSTVHGIVKQSGGNILVYSEQGMGTTFKIYLPRIQEQIEVRKTTPIPIDSKHGTETILLVEDEQMVRKLIRRSLATAGYKVLEAANPGEAEEISRNSKDPIELLLTDIVMPEMNGRQLARRLQAKRPALAVVFMSGYSDNVILHQRILEPGIHFLQKPFSPASLLQKIRSVLDAQNGNAGVGDD